MTSETGRLKNGTKVIITHGRYKGETGIVEGNRVSANYETMYWVRRDRKNARVSVMQFTSHFLQETKI